ncbi:arsenate reductase/protein-tyrosine-phosphatase family protein [Rhizobium yanglingense]
MIPAGTGGWHQGKQPDRRSIAIARAHGIDITGQRARRVRLQDFEEFDLDPCNGPRQYCRASRDERRAQAT